jgi:hypothetical protein
LAPLNCGGLNSTHIHGTRAPVEEPSTASKADICGATSDVRFGPKADIANCQPTAPLSRQAKLLHSYRNKDGGAELGLTIVETTEV